MTAEIAVINRQAVVMASDSAATVDIPGRGVKIFNSVNKLFTLNEKEKIGLMIYGSSMFMGIPWGTIVAEFKHVTYKSNNSTLESYSNDLIYFLENEFGFIDKDRQREYFRENLKILFANIKNKLYKTISDRIFTVGVKKINIPATIKRNINKIILEELAIWDNSKYLNHFEYSYIEKFFEEYIEDVKIITGEVFADMDVNTINMENMYKLAFYMVVKDKFGLNNSGVVLAGYGDEEIFPVIASLDIEPVFADKLKYRKNIDVITSGNIYKYAQSDVFDTFLNGISPQFKKYIIDEVQKILSEYFGKVIGVVSEEKAVDEKKQIAGVFSREKDELREKFVGSIKQYEENYMIPPLRNMISVMPIREMVELAESLINITSLRRKIDSGHETVGGPVDILVISKESGCQWYARKEWGIERLTI